MNVLKYSLSVLFLTFLLFSSCNVSKTDENIISVTIEPERYFAEKLAGNKFIIQSVVPSGQSPETFDPAPQQMIAIGKSIAYFQIGHLGFEEAWMPKIKDNNPHLKIFNLSEGIELITDSHECTGHHHHDEDDHLHHHHHHGGIDPHTWSSISGARVIVWNMLQAFLQLDPENQQFYWNNYNQLMNEIDETEKTIQELLTSVTNRTFIIYHPALTYFAQENGLTQLCIEMDGKDPSPAQIKELIDIAQQEKTQIVFIQQEFDQKNAEIIAKETGCRLVPINPLDYNWSREMIHIAKSLANE